MIRAGLVCLLGFVAVAGVPVDQGSVVSKPPRAIQIRVNGFDEIQAWFQRLHQHEPWQQDAAVSAVTTLSPKALETILYELSLVRQLLDDAASKGIEEIRVLTRRLKTSQLAALMLLTDAELDMPYNVKNLARADNPARIAITRLMVRAASLHTLIALSPVESRDLPADLQGQKPRPGLRPGEMHSTVRIQDGRQVATVNLSVHWTLARAALDLAGPPPASSAAVRLWYQATAADMQVRRDYAALQPHLEYARQVLDGDAMTFLLSGAAFENIAAPLVQSAIAESNLGHLEVGTPDDLRAQAERHLRRALALDPTFDLARLRLGRVLQLQGRHADAAMLLRQAEPALSSSVWRYFAALYLGRSEHALGRSVEARAAYQRAIALYPKVQSPRLGLAEVAWLGADQATGVADLRALFSSVAGPVLDPDPWWWYDISHVDAAMLWEEMRVATGKAAR